MRQPCASSQTQIGPQQWQQMAHATSSPFALLHDFLRLPPATPSRCSVVLRPQLLAGCRSSMNSSFRVKSNPVDSPSDPASVEESISQPELVKDNNENASSSQNVEITELPNKDVNRRIAIISTSTALGLFLSRRLDFGVSLKDLSASAKSYEEALSNGKPTVVEFYADWCEVCRELVPDVYKVEQRNGDRVNFVMLIVDNTKWEQEIDEFGLEGIPHFAFLDKMEMKRVMLWVDFHSSTYWKMLLPLLMENPQFLMPVLWVNTPVQNPERLTKLLILEVMARHVPY